MDERQLSDSEAKNLKFLRMLVTVLTATMILGVLTIIALLVIRLQAPASPRLPALPASINLPDGGAPTAITFGDGWTAVVIEGNRILVFDVSTGDVRLDANIEPAN